MNFEIFYFQFIMHQDAPVLLVTRPPGLLVVQKWSIVAAVYVIVHQILAVLTYTQVWEDTVYYGTTDADYVLRVIGILIAIGRVVTSILVLVPSYTKEPQAAHKWRIFAFPYMLFNFHYIIYTLVFHIYHKFRLYFGSSIIDELAFVLEEIALSVALIVCAFFLQRRLQLQMHSHEGGSQQHRRQGLHLVQKWSVVVGLFALVHGILVMIISISALNDSSYGTPLYDVDNKTDKFFQITGCVFGVGKMISSLLIFIPSCKKGRREALYAYPFMMVHAAFMVYIFAVNVYYTFRHFGQYSHLEGFIYGPLSSFLTEITMSVVFIVCAFFLQQRLHRQRDVPSQENIQLQSSPPLV